MTLATVVQDSDEEIRRGLALMSELRVGQLSWAPTVGIPSPIGETDRAAIASAIESALRALDPRPTEIVVELDDEGNVRNIDLQVTTR